VNYKANALMGFFWVGSWRASTRIISLLKIIILARILTPYQFGIFGISTLVLSLLEIFTETGINTVLIQEKTFSKFLLNTAWVVSIARGFLIGIALLLLSYPVSMFFKTQDAMPSLLLISLVPIIRGFINPSIIKLQIDLKFRSDFLYRFTIHAIDASAAIIFTLIYQSPVGFIGGLIVGALFELIISFIFINPHPAFNFETNSLKKILQKGKWITVSGILEYLFREGDDIAVGRALGTTSLGLYQNAYKIATLPISEVADVISKVTLPIFVKISNDSTRLMDAVTKTLIASLILLTPLTILLLIFPVQIINFSLGPQWINAAPILQIVAIYALIRSLITPLLTVFISIGKQQRVTVVNAVAVLAMAITILPLISIYKENGAAISTIIGVVSSLPVVAYYTWYTIKYDLKS
jgi:O-antigen/teichoic acid export membrane protein